MTKYEFPSGHAYLGEPKDREYVTLGLVKARVDYETLDPNREEGQLCKNYFNKAAGDLVKYARQAGGDAVIDVKSVVFMADGKSETHPKAECSDDGEGGQVLTQGVAIKWKPKPKPEPEKFPETVHFLDQGE